MNDESSNNEDQSQKSWLNKIVHAFNHEPQDKADILEFLKSAHDNHLFDNIALSIVEGALQTADLQVRDVMIPRPQMVVVDEDETPEDFLPKIIESGHSRFPVIGDSQDEIVGILLAKDLLPLVLNQDSQKFKLKNILRPVTMIPESKRLTTLLNEFRTNHNHMAVVIDEYGGIAGLITIEDVLEEIVGEIEDEYDIDEDEADIRKLEHGGTVVNALTPIEDFNSHFDLEFSDEEFDTIGGIVMQHFGRLPNRNETVEIADLQFKVLVADNRRIRSLQVQPRPGSADA